MTLYRIYYDILKKSWEVRYLDSDTCWKKTQVTYEQLKETGNYLQRDHKYDYYIR